jgi:hypothetical protein
LKFTHRDHSHTGPGRDLESCCRARGSNAERQIVGMRIDRVRRRGNADDRRAAVAQSHGAGAGRDWGNDEALVSEAFQAAVAKARELGWIA